jgi:hypothetical protein
MKRPRDEAAYYRETIPQFAALHYGQTDDEARRKASRVTDAGWPPLAPATPTARAKRRLQSKMHSGRLAETATFGRLTQLLTCRSTATLQMM